MNEVRQKKLEALNEIVNAYEIYRGGLRSRLEQEINNLECKLDEEQFTNLKIAFEHYRNYFVMIMADSRRVHVNFNTPEITDIETFSNEEE